MSWQLNLNWLNNPGAYGFTEILYEFTSAAANNGSGFEGLGDNTVFWNLLTGMVMMAGRYFPIIGTIAIGGSLAKKKVIPAASGTLVASTLNVWRYALFCNNYYWGFVFIPSLVLGPVAEETSF